MDPFCEARPKVWGWKGGRPGRGGNPGGGVCQLGIPPSQPAHKHQCETYRVKEKLLGCSLRSIQWEGSNVSPPSVVPSPRTVQARACMPERRPKRRAGGGSSPEAPVNPTISNVLALPASAEDARSDNAPTASLFVGTILKSGASWEGETASCRGPGWCGGGAWGRVQRGPVAEA